MTLIPELPADLGGPLALFVQWHADDPAELAHRRQDTDALLAFLQAHSLTLRRLALPDEGAEDAA